MQTLSEPQPAETTALGGALAGSPPAEDPDIQTVALTFAVTPEAARLAVERVGTDFRDLQRELGGRR